MKFLHAFYGYECVIMYYFVKWGLVSNKFDHSPLIGSGLCPLLLLLHHSMFSFLWGLCCTLRWIKGIPLSSLSGLWRPPSGKLPPLSSVLSSPCCEQFVLNQRPSQVLAYRLQASYCPLISLSYTQPSAILMTTNCNGPAHFRDDPMFWDSSSALFLMRSLIGVNTKLFPSFALVLMDGNSCFVSRLTSFLLFNLLPLQWLHIKNLPCSLHITVCTSTYMDLWAKSKKYDYVHPTLT